jgi:hypothetical protein
MSNAVPQCTHIKTNGEVCGSPAVSGTELCYHHSKVKSALGKWTPADQAAYGEFTPIPFIFPEDRASLQIDFFLLLQAFNEQRVDQKTFRLMLSMLKAMAANLGKSGSLVEPTTEGAPSLTSANGGPREQALVHGVEKREPRAGEESDRDQPSAAGEKISVQASASAEVFPTPIAPESCFSTQPPARSLTDLRREVFRTSSFHPAGQRTLNRYFAPLPQR